ncbi:MAG TPA: ATP-binding cassette domain-containing protein [Candidatus Micrarchaeia archaeon]|nr:ATP-binding cassette domain-containing protein [Candidatus Micrarchaeia archaeon]
MASSGARPAPILLAESVTAGYGGAPVITDVTVQVAASEVVSVVGPNGSGKSTLLKSLVGVIRVMSGSVTLKNRAITNWATEDVARAGVGYVPQVDDVFGPLSVRENLEMGGYLLPQREVPARVEHVVGVFPALGRMLTRRAEKLSGGERKMLAMARVLMLQPALFVLDEPTANLAPAIAHTLLHDHIQRLATTGAGVLLVEQRARSALAISSWTYVMGGGQCRTEGSSAELSGRADFVESFLGGAPAHA